MISELFFGGFIGFIFFISFLSYSYLIGPYILEGVESERKAILALLRGALYDFPKHFLLFIGLVLAVASVFSVVSGSWPNWFFSQRDTLYG